MWKNKKREQIDRLYRDRWDRKVGSNPWWIHVLINTQSKSMLGYIHIVKHPVS